jgi:hypothetical protein
VLGAASLVALHVIVQAVVHSAVRARRVSTATANDGGKEWARTCSPENGQLSVSANHRRAAAAGRARTASLEMIVDPFVDDMPSQPLPPRPRATFRSTSLS